jgi:hypothetical protein
MRRGEVALERFRLGEVPEGLFFCKMWFCSKGVKKEKNGAFNQTHIYNI